jgi:effector-binding domain-containing protein
MWKTFKSNQLKNKGQNIWVYESEHKVFAGVELIGRTNEETDLEYKRIYLSHYARFKHIGSYNLISRAGQDMKTELLNRGYEIILPYIEIYGHWTQDETKLETELLMTLK